MSMSKLIHPEIDLGVEYPPEFVGDTEEIRESHDTLLEYLTSRLQSDTERPARLQRYARIDKMVSTWQRLNEQDSQRAQKQEDTGKAQAISQNLPLIHTHLDDMVSFFAGVYAPAAGSFFQTPEPESQEQGKLLVSKMNSDARKHRYYRNLCKSLRALLKYNIGGLALTWVQPDDADGETSTSAKGSNHMEALDMYNFLWDPSIKEPADIRKEAEWSATIKVKNRRWVVSRAQADEYVGVGAVVGEQNDKESNGSVATYYRHPPSHAGLTAEDEKTAGNRSRADWGSYGRSLEGDSNVDIDGHEVIEMFCWLNPADFSLTAGDDGMMGQDGYYLWKFVILDGLRIVSARPVRDDLLDLDGQGQLEIPHYIGHLNVDDMGNAQRSIAELLSPFQGFGSFLLNAHVAGVKSGIWGIQVYDPSMIDMGQMKEGDVVARIASKMPGRDVRTGLSDVKGTVNTQQTMQDLQQVLGLMKEFFPSQAMPAQIAGIDRAVTSQVSAVLQGVSRRLHMIVRTLDDDVLGPMRFAAYTNVVIYKAVAVTGLDDEAAHRILGSGLAQLNREVAEGAMRQLLFAIIQNPNSAQGIDVLKLMNYWSGLLSMETDLTSFAAQQAPAPQGEQPTPQGAPGATPGQA